MSADSPKTIDQIIAEEQARLEERSRDLAEFARIGIEYQRVGAEFQRLAAKLGIPLPELNLPLAAQVVPAAPIPTKEELKASAATAPLNAPRLTMGELIQRYRTHPDSGYFKLKFRVRQNYEAHLNMLAEEIGSMTLREFDADKIRELHERWTEGTKFARSHGLIGKMRLLSTFGITVLKDEDAVRLSTILGSLQFPLGNGPRTERLTAEHAILIRKKAHEMRWHSIAVVQAFQFDLAERLRQIDIIGEWVPLSEPGASDIIRNGTGAAGQEKWLRGIRWNDIDDQLILRRQVLVGRAKKPTTIRLDLNRYPMIMEEIRQLPPQNRISGPLVICEFTGLPWTAVQFRQRWRQVANMAGIPKDVQNADSGRKADEDDLNEESRADAL